MWLAIVSSWCVAFGATAQNEQNDGLSNSAEYIVGFVRYVYWQGEEKLLAWNICIAGDLPRKQERAYANRLVRGKRFAVRRVGVDTPLTDCQVLDLTAIDAQTSDKMLARARHLPILVVGSGSAFCSSGGQICLYLGGNQPPDQQKFEVNISAMKEAGLGVSARLLTLGSPRTASKDVP